MLLVKNQFGGLANVYLPGLEIREPRPIGKLPELVMKMLEICTIEKQSIANSNNNNKEIYGQGSLILGRSGGSSNNNNTKQETTLEVSVTLQLHNDGSEPNLQGQSKDKTKFLRGSQEGV